MLPDLLETFGSVLAGNEATNRHQAHPQLNLVVALSRNVGARGPSEGLAALSSL